MRATNGRVTRVANGMPPHKFGQPQRRTRIGRLPRPPQSDAPVISGASHALVVSRPQRRVLFSMKTVHLPFISTEILRPRTQAESCYVIARITKERTGYVAQEL